MLSEITMVVLEKYKNKKHFEINGFQILSTKRKKNHRNLQIKK